MLATDGRCKTLDASASGYVRAENCVAFLLAATDACSYALEHASIVVYASAVNQDGRSSSLTAPNGTAQQAVIVTALQFGNLPARNIATLEMHGTGTVLGDPIEMRAAAAALQVCIVLSVVNVFVLVVFFVDFEGAARIVTVASPMSTAGCTTRASPYICCGQVKSGPFRDKRGRFGRAACLVPAVRGFSPQHHPSPQCEQVCCQHPGGQTFSTAPGIAWHNVCLHT